VLNAAALSSGNTVTAPPYILLPLSFPATRLDALPLRTPANPKPLYIPGSCPMPLAHCMLGSHTAAEPSAHQACLHRLLSNEADLEHTRDLQQQQQQHIDTSRKRGGLEIRLDSTSGRRDWSVAIRTAWVRLTKNCVVHDIA
jgi:hypothetical protein